MNISLTTDTTNIIYGCLFLFISIVISTFYYKKIHYYFYHLFERKHFDLLLRISLSIREPVTTLFILIGIYVFLSFFFPFSNFTLIAQIWRSVVIFLFAWAVGQFIDTFLGESRINQTTKVSNPTFPYFARVIKFVFWLLCGIALSKEWGFDINGILTGLGISGIAFAFAARETFSNLFCGMVIVLEKSFAIGDWISTSNIEGIVEDIGFRSTKVRTFSDSLIIVPNSKLTNDSLINLSRMGKRKVEFKTGIKKSGSTSNLESFINEYILYLRNRNDVEQESVYVYLEKINNDFYEINIEFNLTITTKVDLLLIKQEIMLKTSSLIKMNALEVYHINSPVQIVN